MITFGFSTKFQQILKDLCYRIIIIVLIFTLYFDLSHCSDRRFCFWLIKRLTSPKAHLGRESFYWSHACLTLEGVCLARYLARWTFARIWRGMGGRIEAERGFLREFEIPGDQGGSYPRGLFRIQWYRWSPQNFPLGIPGTTALFDSARSSRRVYPS